MEKKKKAFTTYSFEELKSDEDVYWLYEGHCYWWESCSFAYKSVASHDEKSQEREWFLILSNCISPFSWKKKNAYEIIPFQHSLKSFNFSLSPDDYNLYSRTEINQLPEQADWNSSHLSVSSRILLKKALRSSEVSPRGGRQPLIYSSLRSFDCWPLFEIQ